MTANICYLCPKKTLNCLSISFSVKLRKEIATKFVVVEIINNNIHIREALDMDDGLKILEYKSKSSSARVSFNCKRGSDFIGAWNVRQEDEYFVLYKRKINNNSDED